MRILLSLWLVTAMLVGSLPMPARAVQVDDPDGLSMAVHFAPDTVFYLSFPLPKADLLDFYDEQIMQQLPPTLGVPDNIRDLLNENLASMGTDIDSLFAMFGDYAAVGVGSIDAQTGTLQTALVYVEIADRAAVEALLQTALSPVYVPQTDGDFSILRSTTDPVQWAVNDDFLIVSSGFDAVPDLTPAPSLAGNANFQAAFAALPEETYDSALYADLETLMAADDFAMPAGSGTVPGYAGPLAVGLKTMPGTDTMVLDSAQLPGPLGGLHPVTPVNLDFARFLPSDVSLAFHGTDLAAGYAALLEQGALMSADVSGIEDGLAEVGIDLQEDILSWVSGDYAAFWSIDILPIARAALESRIEVSEHLDFGLVIEATNADKAGALAAKLGELAQTRLAGQPAVTVASDQIQGTEATIIQVASDLTPTDTFTMEVALGANDDVFFIATRRAAEAILGQGDHLVDHPDYIAARELFVPDPVYVVYGDAAGALTPVVTIVGLVALGPAIGRVFENVVQELESSPPQSTMPEPQFIAYQTVDPTAEALLGLLESILATDGSVSISQTVTPDGVSLVRVTSSAPELALLMSSVGTVGMLAVVGPAVGQVYRDIEAEIDDTGSAPLFVTPTAAPGN